MAELPCAPAGTISYVGVLRRRTRDLHARAERAFPLMHPELDRDRYTATLLGLLGVHEPLEAEVARVLEPAGVEALAWRTRRRAPLLRADLADLGVPRPRVPALPAPVVRSVAAAIGALYVLEGSTLGATIVRQQVLDRLGPAVPVRYLDGSGTATMERWSAFRRAANEVLGDGGIDEAVVAARATFRAVEAAVA